VVRCHPRKYGDELHEFNEVIPAVLRWRFVEFVEFVYVTRIRILRELVS
jgi:hypothetical protein